MMGYRRSRLWKIVFASGYLKPGNKVNAFGASRQSGLAQSSLEDANDYC